MKLEWTTPAVSDLENIKAYIQQDSEYYASRFVARIIEVIETLREFPNRGRAVPEAGNENVREIFFRNYRIMYRIVPEKIQLLTILHGAQDIHSKEKKPWEIV